MILTRSEPRFATILPPDKKQTLIEPLEQSQHPPHALVSRPRRTLEVWSLNRYVRQN
jgi:hypothetical protein